MNANDSGEAKALIRAFINASINIDGLGDDDNLFETGIVNSLFAVQLTRFIERQFGLEIGVEDLDLANFKSVNAAAAFVARKSGCKVS